MSSVPKPMLLWPSEDEVSTEELARRQGVRPIGSLQTLRHSDVWESDEEFQDFLRDLYASRRSDFS